MTDDRPGLIDLPCRPQDGLLVLGQPANTLKVNASWIDSWHMGDAIMLCEGTAEPGGAVWVHGSYAAPSGPGWGWRISLLPEGRDQFKLLIHNITPDRQELLAVKVTYARQ